jgi:hypothetical protein
MRKAKYQNRKTIYNEAPKMLSKVITKKEDAEKRKEKLLKEKLLDRQ